MTAEQQMQYKYGNQFMSGRFKLRRRQSNFNCGSVPSCFANCFQNSWSILDPMLMKLKLREMMLVNLAVQTKYRLRIKIRIMRGAPCERKLNRKFWPKHKGVAREECGIPGSWVSRSESHFADCRCSFLSWCNGNERWILWIRVVFFF